jgi:hypothetical protein
VNRYFKAGDFVTIIRGPGTGKTHEIAAVRMFATDSGYYLHDGDGLYAHRDVVLAHERTNGNPCGTPCSDRDHESLDTCEHCRGTCFCRLLNTPAEKRI